MHPVIENFQRKSREGECSLLVFEDFSCSHFLPPTHSYGQRPSSTAAAGGFGHHCHSSTNRRQDGCTEPELRTIVRKAAAYLPACVLRARRATARKLTHDLLAPLPTVHARFLGSQATGRRREQGRQSTKKLCGRKARRRVRWVATRPKWTKSLARWQHWCARSRRSAITIISLRGRW